MIILGSIEGIKNSGMSNNTEPNRNENSVILNSPINKDEPTDQQKISENYENELDATAKDYDNSTIISEEDDDSLIDIMSESELQDTAKKLLCFEHPDIILHYKHDVYMLFKSTNPEYHPSLRYVLMDNIGLHVNLNVVLSSIRQFIQNTYGSLEVANREIFLNFTDLSLNLGEDNIYIRNITINDIVSIFEALKRNSIQKQESNIPTHININISLLPRFVSRYNDLVEMIDNDAGFSSISGFSNDIEHPLLLDDGEILPNNGLSAVVIGSDEDKPNKTDASDLDDSDLLEIVDEIIDEDHNVTP